MALLTLLVEKAEQTVLTLCNITELPEGISDVIEDIVCFRYNQRGYEGLESQTMGSVGVNISQELPSSILSKLNSFKRARFK